MSFVSFLLRLPGAVYLQAAGGASQGASALRLETALHNLGFAVKSLQLYPPTSPVVRQALERSLASLTPLFVDGHLTLEVTPRLVRSGEIEIGPGKAVVEQLARRLHRHGVARLHFDAAVDVDSLRLLAELVATDRRLLDARGGFDFAFKQSKPIGIRAEFLELDRLFDNEAEEVEDLWEALLDGFRMATELEDVDWESLADDVERLQEFMAWTAARLGDIAQRTGHDKVDVFRLVVEHLGKLAGASGSDRVQSLSVAVRRAFDEIDPDILIELLAEPLEVEVEGDLAAVPANVSLTSFLAESPGGQLGEDGATGRRNVVDITQLIASGLESSQAEQLMLHTIRKREGSSPRLYGLFSRLMQGRDNRLEMAHEVCGALEQDGDEAEEGEDFLENWPRLVDVLVGEAPERFLSPSYETALRRLLADDSLVRAWPIERIRPRLEELRPEFMLQRKALVLTEVLRIEREEGQYEAVAEELGDKLRALVARHDYVLALRLLQTLSAHSAPGSEQTDAQRRVAGRILAAFYAPGNLRELLRHAFGRARQDLDTVSEILVLGGVETIPVFLDALGEEDNRRMRLRLIQMLSRFGPSAARAMAAQLNDQRWYFVRNLALLLGRAGDNSQVEKLAALLDHPDARVRREVMEAIIKLGGDAAAAALVRGVDDADEITRQIAIHGLGFHRSEAGTERLRAMLRLPNRRGQNTPTIQIAAIALGRLLDEASKPRLARLCKKPWLFPKRRKPVQDAAAWAAWSVDGKRRGPAPEPRFLGDIQPLDASPSKHGR